MPKILHPNPIIDQARVIIFAIFITVVLYLIRDYIPDLFMAAVVLTWIVSVFAAIFYFVIERFVTLEIDEKDMMYRKGILAVKTTLVPYSKVTDARYNQSLLERILGLGTLEVETASESGVAIRIRGVRYDDVEVIMKNVREKSGAN